MAPRMLYVGSAKDDIWADPVSEYISLLAAQPAYKLLGIPGELPEKFPYMPVQTGRTAYQIRFGSHYLSNRDWRRYMRFFKDCMKADNLCALKKKKEK